MCTYYIYLQMFEVNVNTQIQIETNSAIIFYHQTNRKDKLTML